jgi:radical SAM protein with 4Fe4S-binding SPASM domain
VLPCQSYYHQLGNLLVDDWNTIWNHDLAVRLRERQGLPEKCTGCALLAECGGGCPLSRGGTGTTQCEEPVRQEAVA